MPPYQAHEKVYNATGNSQDPHELQWQEHNGGHEGHAVLPHLGHELLPGLVCPSHVRVALAALLLPPGPGTSSGPAGAVAVVVVTESASAAALMLMVLLKL